MMNLKTSDYATYKHDKVIRFIDSLKHRWRRFPPSLQIGVTDYCYNKCPMCGHWKRRNKRQLDVGMLIDFLMFAKSKGLESVGYSGGDPFAYKSFNKLMKWHIKNDVAFGVVTAGFVPKWVDMELLLQAAWVRVSLDSVDKKLYDEFRGGSINLSEVLDSIHRMVEAGVRVGIGTTITRHNIEPISRIGGILHYATSNGIQEIRFWLVRDHSRISPDPTQKKVLSRFLTSSLEHLSTLDTNLETVIESLKPEPEVVHFKHCYVTSYQLFIDADGGIYPCCTTAGDTEAAARLAPYSSIYRKDLKTYWEVVVWPDIVRFSQTAALPDVCKGECIQRHRIANRIAEDNWNVKSFQ